MRSLIRQRHPVFRCRGLRTDASRRATPLLYSQIVKIAHGTVTSQACWIARHSATIKATGSSSSTLLICKLVLGDPLGQMAAQPLQPTCNAPLDIYTRQKPGYYAGHQSSFPLLDMYMISIGQASGVRQAAVEVRSGLKNKLILHVNVTCSIARCKNTFSPLISTTLQL